MKKIVVGFAAILAFWSLVKASCVKAQTVTKLVAIPPRLEVEVQPGEVAQKVIKVRNESDSEIGIQVKIYDFIVADDQGTPIPVDEEISGRWAASTWTHISPTKFILKAGETKELDLIIITPEDAAPGGHYAVVFYQPITGDLEVPGSASFVAPNVGTLLYLTVPGDITEEAFVRRMDIPKFSEFGPIKIITEIENLSDIHIKPLGVIRIYNWFDRLSTTLKLDEQNIFPGRSRVYENTWNRKWLFGRYKAKLEAGYGTQGNTLLAVAYFWVIPWRVILVALLIIILITLLIIYWRRRRKVVLPQPQLN